MRTRRSARVILVDPAERVLLVGIEEPVSLGPGVFWIITGGGLEAGETFEAAVRREVWEETGISIVELGPCVWTRRLPLTFNGETMLSDERYFLARVAPSEAVLDHQTDPVERSHWRGHKRWRIAEMAPSGERFLPRHLADLLQPMITGELPSEPIALLR